MSRSRARRSGSLALRLALVCGAAALLTSGIVLVLVVQTLAGTVGGEGAAMVQRAWLLGAMLCVVAGAVVGLSAYLQGAGIAQRLTDLGLAANKLGRGSAAVRVRNIGNDEVTSLGKTIQYLANDLSAMFEEQEAAGTVTSTFDPQVRALRDRVLPQSGLPEVEGFELDAALAAGSRGGLDYFDAVTKDGAGVLLVVSAEGTGPAAVYACRQARDEIVRALQAGASARKALAHTNRVMHRLLPPSVCAKATLIELGAEAVKLYQCGARVPCLVCAAGEVSEQVADGLALGLDEGPVFEKQLRSTTIPVSPGVRLVLTNEAGHRHEEFVELVRSHSAKNTMAFMNMVLGGIEGGGEDGLREDVVLVTAKRW